MSSEKCIRVDSKRVFEPAQTIGEIISKLLFCNDCKYEEMTMLLDTCSGASGPTHIVHSQIDKRFKEFIDISKKKMNNGNNIPFCTILSDLWPHVSSWQKLSNKYINLGLLYLIEFCVCLFVCFAK